MPVAFDLKRWKLFRLLVPFSICRASGGTEACASAFGSSYGGGASASPAQIRAFLYVCYECNSYNTGNG